MENIKMENGKNITIETESATTPTTEHVDIDKLLALPGTLPAPRKIPENVTGEMEYRTVESLDKAYSTGEIRLPDYQRGLSWDGARQRWYAYSVVNSLPTPPLMLVVTDKALDLIDGQQRLTAIRQRLNDLYNAVVQIDKSLTSATDSAVKATLSAQKDRVLAEYKALVAAKIPVIVWRNLDRDSAVYAYAALNNGKAHTGAELGRAFIPAGGMDFVIAAQKAVGGIMDAKKAASYALYLWAAFVLPIRKAPAGGKAFRIARNMADTLQDFVFPAYPEGWEKVVDAIGKRPVKSTDDFPIADFPKPGFIVPLIQGYKLWGGNDPSVLAYVIRNIDRLVVPKVSVVTKEGKGKDKAPVTTTCAFINLLAKSGSGEMLCYSKAQGWAKVLTKAAKEIDAAAKEDAPDTVLAALIDAAKGADTDD